jgi:hypothetical protein
VTAGVACRLLSTAYYAFTHALGNPAFNVPSRLFDLQEHVQHSELYCAPNRMRHRRVVL